MKNYRVIVEKILDLADARDPLDLAQTCESAAAALRLAAKLRDERREAEQLNEAVAPWFDPRQNAIIADEWASR